MLAVRHLTKRFGGFAAVNDLSFDLGPGEILGLIGPNGSGKSTTFSLLAGLLAPTSGSVHFNGAELAGSGANAICRQGIGRTFQIPRPFSKLTVLENVTLAAFYGNAERVSRTEAERRAVDALRLVGLPIDPRATTAGMGAAGLKKLEMARALATQPKLLLADESLGGLDEAEMDQAADMLLRIRDERGIAIIWVEHIMGVLMRVIDRCIVLDHGELIASGKPSEVAHDPRVVEVYLGTDAAEVQQRTSGAMA
ncbi:ABC transporter ATP-binding protein [Verminephrobacter eiseniae]|uniref:ABC transporter ATP-binding protein n=1 Tax=Verminephrobacter eiseniae TaxID=364317 RepID=UPI0022372252|nr:ABC transporter ATP-binding protein [Verminephrobacter eiseniae]MCW5233478.1 ABC transporter ATP-binding protein [Verminephrobacter eiseniae]MCW5261632.1 ABC transporter ATP-binding protein [Verminephrobacter eiseniae]MCW5294969.1 ABC transporter ATP-binding protein [Verminephrobacter eiseniae]MCW8184237.1 ABC transporter ATP-binding protein [Verminephrobacter eiseniae]MCW8222774.1 ABC transporter ATP-binding protein [Verminephrobacter eiseniae]